MLTIQSARRNRPFVLAACAILASAMIPAAAKDKKEGKEAAASPVVLRINGEDVTKADFDEMFKGNERFYNLTDQSIRERLNGKPLAEYLFREEMLKTMIAEQENKDALPAMKETADAALERIKGGADFGEVAKEVSQDQGTAPNGGLMSLQEFFKLVQPFNRVAFSMKQGEIRGPILTIFGYHLIKVDKIYPPMDGKAKRMDIRHILIRFPSAGADVRQKIEEGVKSAKVEVLDKSYCKKLPSYCEAGEGL